MSSVPDHHNKASIAVKKVIIFFLVKGLAFNSKKKKSGKYNKMQYGCTS